MAVPRVEQEVAILQREFAHLFGGSINAGEAGEIKTIVPCDVVHLHVGPSLVFALLATVLGEADDVALYQLLECFIDPPRPALGEDGLEVALEEGRGRFGGSFLRWLWRWRGPQTLRPAGPRSAAVSASGGMGITNDLRSLK